VFCRGLLLVRAGSDLQVGLPATMGPIALDFFALPPILHFTHQTSVAVRVPHAGPPGGGSTRTHLGLRYRSSNSQMGFGANLIDSHKRPDIR